MSTFAIPNEKNGSPNAEIAQLVEHNLAKVGVASSSLVFRSKTKEVSRNADLLFEKISPDGVPLYVSRPCAQGRLFCFISYIIDRAVTVTSIPSFKEIAVLVNDGSKLGDFRADFDTIVTKTCTFM